MSTPVNVSALCGNSRSRKRDFSGKYCRVVPQSSPARKQTARQKKYLARMALMGEDLFEDLLEAVFLVGALLQSDG